MRSNHYRLVIIFIPLIIGTLFFHSGCKKDSSPPPPPPPSLLAAPVGITAVAGNGSITISWTAVEGAVTYHVYRSRAPGVNSLSGAISPNDLNSTSFIDSVVSAGSTYYYAVAAINDAGDSNLSGEVSAAPTDSDPAVVSIAGKIRYQDREYGAHGFTGSKPYKAVRFATVELVSAGSVTSTTTGADGAFSFSGVTATSGEQKYVRVLAEARLSGSTPRIEVKDLSSRLYAVAGSNFTPSGPANVTISVPDSSVAGAFNILDVFTIAYQFVNELASGYPSAALSAFWEKGNRDGTFFCTGACRPGEGIFILGDSSDTDEYDDDVLWHEFGHFAANHYSRDDSQGGPHTISSNDLDLRLAWSEGWGNFFQMAVKKWLFSDPAKRAMLSADDEMPLTRYVDTAPGGIRGTFDFSNAGTPPFIYASNEAAVAKILWELNDAHSMQSVWDVVDGFNAASPASPNQVNLEAFWDGWSATQAVNVSDIFESVRVRYKNDLFEPDDAPNAARLSAGFEHTLYPANNADFIAFPATQGIHTVQTFDLLNGADTFMELYDPSGSLIDQNDNSSGNVYTNSNVPSGVPGSGLCDDNEVCHDNGFDILGSSITFNAPSSGTYSVKIYSSPARPVSAGKYGTFTLRID